MCVEVVVTGSPALVSFYRGGTSISCIVLCIVCFTDTMEGYDQNAARVPSSRNKSSSQKNSDGHRHLVSE